MKLYKTIGIITALVVAVLFLGCKGKKTENNELTEEEVKSKVEAAAMNYAKTDEDLGDYDSIKFVTYTPYFKSKYCATMCDFLAHQRDALQPQIDSAIDARDNDALVKLSESMDKIQSSIDYFNKQSYNTLSTKDDPVVLYEAKCYCYTDGYIQEYLYYVTKDWKVIVLDPYDLNFLK